MNVGDRLAEIMRRRGVPSAKQLAGMSGVSQTMISKILRGESSPTSQTLELLCKALGISMSEFYETIESALDEQLSDVEFALYGGIRNMTLEEKLDLKSYMEFVQSKKRVAPQRSAKPKKKNSPRREAGTGMINEYYVKLLTGRELRV